MSRPKCQDCQEEIDDRRRRIRCKYCNRLVCGYCFNHAHGMISEVTRANFHGGSTSSEPQAVAAPKQVSLISE